MSRKVIMSLNLLGVLALTSACSPFSTQNLEKEVQEYNSSIETMVETYVRQIPKEETTSAVVDYAIKGNRSDYLSDDVELTALSEELIEDFKAPLETKNNYYTTTTYKGVKHVVMLNGYTKQMYIEATWLDNKIITIERTIIGGDGNE